MGASASTIADAAANLDRRQRVLDELQARYQDLRAEVDQ